MFEELFSPTEQKVLKVINRFRAGVGTKEIAKEVYNGKKRPKNYRMVISNSVSRIKAKAEAHKLEWTLQVYNFGCKGKMVSKVWVE